jgi:hypothetical protein
VEFPRTTQRSFLRGHLGRTFHSLTPWNGEQASNSGFAQHQILVIC